MAALPPWEGEATLLRARHGAPGPVPRLFFRTTPLIADAETRLSLSSPDRSLLSVLRACHDLPAAALSSWVRGGQGLVGLGRLLTIEGRGAHRIEDLRAAWRATVYASWWRDALVRPGTGPVALGTIAFAEESSVSSVLVVPRILLGVDEQGAWLTCAALSEEELPAHEEVLAALEALVHGTEVAHTSSPSMPLPQLRLTQGSRSDEEYLASLARVQERMRAGEAHKVVMARDVVVQPEQDGDPLPLGHVLARLGESYPSCWTFAVDGMIGASPELLVRLSGRRLTSRVLAGTARRTPSLTGVAREEEAETLADWLDASDKNNREHELARASALAALEPLCSVVEAPSRYVLTLPNVLHLASDISGVVAGDTGALSLVGALHPTAAVGGTPTGAALAIITQEEGMDRGRYAGPVGWVDWRGEGEWCIALRSGQIGEATSTGAWSVRVFGGGGIMPDSEPRDELAETRAKMRPMLTALDAH